MHVIAELRPLSIVYKQNSNIITYMPITHHVHIKHYAEDLGYEYLSANNKDEYVQVVDRFLIPEITDRPMILEVFTDNADESEAIRIINNLNVSTTGMMRSTAKEILGEKGIKIIKKILNK